MGSAFHSWRVLVHRLAEKAAGLGLRDEAPGAGITWPGSSWVWWPPLAGEVNGPTPDGQDFASWSRSIAGLRPPALGLLELREVMLSVLMAGIGLADVEPGAWTPTQLINCPAALCSNKAASLTTSTMTTHDLHIFGAEYPTSFPNHNSGA